MTTPGFWTVSFYHSPILHYDLRLLSRSDRRQSLSQGECQTAPGICHPLSTPWKSYSTADPDREYAALLSYLPLKRAWRLPWFMLQSIRIQRQLRASRGLIGYSVCVPHTDRKKERRWPDAAGM